MCASPQSYRLNRSGAGLVTHPNHCLSSAMTSPDQVRTSHLICEIEDEDAELVSRLKAAREARLGAGGPPRTPGDRIADRVAAMVGSWPFIIVQSLLLLLWIALNLTAFIKHWDPYPFILLNLALSFQAAYAAPFIMMSQNRQAAVDRAAAESAYDVNIEAELEIELLHRKIDRMRTEELAGILQILETIRDK
jgi:uncharacterized membrane protein